MDQYLLCCRLSSVLSMNAAVSASVVLASRLTTDISVFALMLFSIQAFALFPMLRHRLQASLPLLSLLIHMLIGRPQSSPVVLWVAITISLSTLAVWLVANLSSTVFWIYLIILVFITLIAPAILIWAQRYKK